MAFKKVGWDGEYEFDTICPMCAARGKWTGIIINPGMWGYYKQHLPMFCKSHPSLEVQKLARAVRAEGWAVTAHFDKLLKDKGIEI